MAPTLKPDHLPYHQRYRFIFNIIDDIKHNWQGCEKKGDVADSNVSSS